ncbi:hypothetical protein K1719_014496 [Acacia pycnantha]|nr:hypothetical protein K1719_014496 [Acacia pycnantha]
MNSLIIKFTGLSVPKHVLIDRVRRMWKPKQPLKIVPLSNEYYIVSFSSKEDQDYAYYEWPWMIDDHYLLVQRWRPNFNPRIANCKRKICVEVDLLKPLLPAFTAFGENKQLVFEGLHLVCFCCGRYMHAKATCDQRKVGDDEEFTKDQERSSKGCQKQTTGGLNEVTVGNDFGSSQDQSTRDQVAASGEGCTYQTTAKQTQTIPSRTSGGGNHLGPQMVFHRDLHRATAGGKDTTKTGGLAKTSGLMREILDLGHGSKRSENNQAGTKGSERSKQHSGKSRVEILGVLNQGVGGIGSLKSEWVVVGSKRKKAERPKSIGKENRARPKLKAK